MPLRGVNGRQSSPGAREPLGTPLIRSPAVKLISNGKGYFMEETGPRNARGQKSPSGPLTLGSTPYDE